MSRTRKEQLGIEHALLGFVQDGPLHGYELHGRLQAAQALGLVWHLKQAQLYALIGKLEAGSLLTAELIQQDARPPRRVLHLTDAGRAAFATWLHTPVAHGRDLRIEFLAKLFWAQHAGPDAVRTLIAAQRTACHGWHADLQRDVVHTDQPYAELVARFRAGQIGAMLRWLDECEHVLIHDSALP